MTSTGFLRTARPTFLCAVVPYTTIHIHYLTLTPQVTRLSRKIIMLPNSATVTVVEDLNWLPNKKCGTYGGMTLVSYGPCVPSSL